MFRFTIREVVLLTAIVAMGFAWAADRAGLLRVWKSSERHCQYERWVVKVLTQELSDVRDTDRILVDRTSPTVITMRWYGVYGRGSSTCSYPNLPMRLHGGKSEPSTDVMIDESGKVVPIPIDEPPKTGKPSSP